MSSRRLRSSSASTAQPQSDPIITKSSSLKDGRAKRKHEVKIPISMLYSSPGPARKTTTDSDQEDDETWNWSRPSQIIKQTYGRARTASRDDQLHSPLSSRKRVRFTKSVAFDFRKNGRREGEQEDSQASDTDSDEEGLQHSPPWKGKQKRSRERSTGQSHLSSIKVAFDIDDGSDLTELSSDGEDAQDSSQAQTSQVLQPQSRSIDDIAVQLRGAIKAREDIDDGSDLTELGSDGEDAQDSSQAQTSKVLQPQSRSMDNIAVQLRGAINMKEEQRRVWNGPSERRRDQDKRVSTLMGSDGDFIGSIDDAGVETVLYDPESPSEFLSSSNGVGANSDSVASSTGPPPAASNTASSASASTPDQSHQEQAEISGLPISGANDSRLSEAYENAIPVTEPETYHDLVRTTRSRGLGAVGNANGDALPITSAASTAAVKAGKKRSRSRSQSSDTTGEEMELERSSVITAKAGDNQMNINPSGLGNGESSLTSSASNQNSIWPKRRNKYKNVPLVEPRATRSRHSSADITLVQLDLDPPRKPRKTTDFDKIRHVEELQERLEAEKEAVEMEGPSSNGSPVDIERVAETPQGTPSLPQRSRIENKESDSELRSVDETPRGTSTLIMSQEPQVENQGANPTSESGTSSDAAVSASDDLSSDRLEIERILSPPQDATPFRVRPPIISATSAAAPPSAPPSAPPLSLLLCARERVNDATAASDPDLTLSPVALARTKWEKSQELLFSEGFDAPNADFAKKKNRLWEKSSAISRKSKSARSNSASASASTSRPPASSSTLSPLSSARKRVQDLQEHSFHLTLPYPASFARKKTANSQDHTFDLTFGGTLLENCKKKRGKKQTEASPTADTQSVGSQNKGKEKEHEHEREKEKAKEPVVGPDMLAFESTTTSKTRPGERNRKKLKEAAVTLSMGSVSLDEQQGEPELDIERDALNRKASQRKKAKTTQQREVNSSDLSRFEKTSASLESQEGLVPSLFKVNRPQRAVRPSYFADQYAHLDEDDVESEEEPQSPEDELSISDSISKPTKTSRQGRPTFAAPTKFIIDMEGGRKAQVQQVKCEQMNRTASNRHLFTCVGCRDRMDGYCCFKGFRCFILKDKTSLSNGYGRTAQAKIPTNVEISWVAVDSESAEVTQPDPDPDTHFFRPLTKTENDVMMKLTARHLSSSLEAAIEHASLPNSVHRAQNVDERQECDMCKTSIFHSSWMCVKCGRDACPLCYEEIMKLEKEATRDSVNHEFKNCGPRHKHTASDFLPIASHQRAELEEELNAMRQINQISDNSSNHIDSPRSSISTLTFDSSRSDNEPLTPPVADISSQTAKDKDVQEQLWSSSTASALEPQPLRNDLLLPSTLTFGDQTIAPKYATPLQDRSVDPEGIGSHPLLYYSKEEISHELFRFLWSFGIPIVLWDVKVNTDQGDGHTWTAKDFLPWADETCSLISCEYPEGSGPVGMQSSIGHFLSTLGKDDKTKEKILGMDGGFKLKDFPTDSSLPQKMPALALDFDAAVPMGQLACLNGPSNLGAFYPAIGSKPDLGPKLYIAHRGNMQSGGRGSTGLHFDVSDAVNMMPDAPLPPLPDGSPNPDKGGACWDIFRAEDSDGLRDFLRERFGLSMTMDPIHSQLFYIDLKLRKELWDAKRIRSWRFIQKVGEAVFIPAGCAHQVCNMSDCLKIAIDFISPENVPRCVKLSKEYQAMAQDGAGKAWKEDMLQLKMNLWHAWRMCRKFDERFKIKEQKKEKQNQTAMEVTTERTDAN